MYRAYKVSIWHFPSNTCNIVYSLFEFAIRIKLFKQIMLTNKLIKYSTLNVSHGTRLEIIWTLVPSFILLLIVGPSFALLFAMDAITDPEYSIKIIGHQWYWSYEYSDSLILNNFISKINLDTDLDSVLSNFNNNKIYDMPSIDYHFDSYMIPTDDLAIGELRLLEVDNALYLPTFSKIRLDITSDDVMHAFAVPSLGLKIDAIPGRLNVLYVDILREGVFFGQCSELCGVNHGYMPIKILAIDLRYFIQLLFINGLESFIWKGSCMELVDLFNFVMQNNYKHINNLKNY